MQRTLEKVYSEILDDNIRKDIKGSPIWKSCYHEDDTKSKKGLYEYSIYFRGLVPIQVTKITKR